MRSDGGPIEDIDGGGHRLRPESSRGAGLLELGAHCLKHREYIPRSAQPFSACTPGGLSFLSAPRSSRYSCTSFYTSSLAPSDRSEPTRAIRPPEAPASALKRETKLRISALPSSRDLMGIATRKRVESSMRSIR